MGPDPGLAEDHPQGGRPCLLRPRLLTLPKCDLDRTFKVNMTQTWTQRSTFPGQRTGHLKSSSDQKDLSGPNWKL